MRSSNALDPETLAKIAAQLNPQLACDDPAKAIELARRLLIAANPELGEEDAERSEEIRLQKEDEREDELFPHAECISVAEAFKASPAHFKTESGFAAALRKERLTTVVQSVNIPEWQKAWPHEEEQFVQRSEVTTIRAVNELFRRQRERTKARDRVRKVTSPNKKFEKLHGNFERQTRKSGAKKRKSGVEKRNLEGKKRNLKK
jgi:hypothetical protein